MEKEQTTIRLPTDLKAEVRQQADKLGKSKQTTMRIQTKLYKELKMISEQSGLTVTSLLIVAIWRRVLKPQS